MNFACVVTPEGVFVNVFASSDIRNEFYMSLDVDMISNFKYLRVFVASRGPPSRNEKKKTA